MSFHGEPREREEERERELCSRAIFSKPVMCPISLRGYKREERAEKGTRGRRGLRRVKEGDRD